jgi:proteasome accessory factor A
MLHRIFGLETEYGLLINQERPEHSPTWIAHRIRDHVFFKQRRGVVDLHHRGHDEPPGNGGFLTNAGRIYMDMGHLEFASPECGTLSDLIASDRAGDRILQQALDELGLSDHVSLIKNNIDHATDATFGSHENYLVSRQFPFTRRGLGLLIPFLVTRQIFTGAGRIGAAAPDGWIPVIHSSGGRPWLRDAATTREDIEGEMGPFQISQRADHIVNDFFQWVQGNRAIVNTRDEPLADPNRFRRIHLLLGDSNLAEFATALKLGTTALVLQLIEEGHCPKGLDIYEPVDALKEISRDPERRWLVTLESGVTVSAIDVQETYLREAQRRYRGQDEESDWVLAEWERVLADLRGDHAKLVGRVDWASKLWLLESFRESERLEWHDPWLRSLDLEYHNLHPEKGLYLGLLQEGRVPRVTTDSAVALAEQHPPRNTRAFGRAEVVRHLLESTGTPPRRADAGERGHPPYVINWSAFQLRGQAPFAMPNPFKTYVQEIRTHLRDFERAADHV